VALAGGAPTPPKEGNVDGMPMCQLYVIDFTANEPGDNPVGWLDTPADYSIEPDENTDTFVITQANKFSPSSTLEVDNVHSHVMPASSLTKLIDNNYVTTYGDVVVKDGAKKAGFTVLYVPRLGRLVSLSRVAPYRARKAHAPTPQLHHLFPKQLWLLVGPGDGLLHQHCIRA
jgi:hypothetical protein